MHDPNRILLIYLGFSGSIQNVQIIYIFIKVVSREYELHNISFSFELQSIRQKTIVNE